jgi:protein-S-isoprenylcysteine O-methyltransferase Ste14
MDGIVTRHKSCAVAALGLVLHPILLLLPLLARGEARLAWSDPAIVLFLILAEGLLLADFETLGHEHAAPRCARLTNNARVARRAALCAGLLLLGIFWIGVIERACAGLRLFGWSQYLGALLAITGVLLRAAAVRTLGPSFVTEFSSEGQSLVQHGVYARLRHPSELGNAAFVTGASIMLGGRLALVTTVLAFIPLTIWRIRREERCLREKFGVRYPRHGSGFPGLFP